MNEFHEIKSKVETHEKEICSIKDDLEEHQEKHNKLYIETRLNTKELEYIKKALLYVLGISVTFFLTLALSKIYKKIKKKRVVEMHDSLALELIKTLKSIQVKDGIDGKDGVCFPLNGMFSFVADEEGNIYFYINAEGEISKKLLGNFNGKDGIGINGLSAYEIARKHGFEGTETEWLESLKVGSSNSINSNLLPVALCKFDSQSFIFCTSDKFSNSFTADKRLALILLI